MLSLYSYIYKVRLLEHIMEKEAETQHIEATREIPVLAYAPKVAVNKKERRKKFFRRTVGALALAALMLSNEQVLDRTDIGSVPTRHYGFPTWDARIIIRPKEKLYASKLNVSGLGHDFEFQAIHDPIFQKLFGKEPYIGFKHCALTPNSTPCSITYVPKADVSLTTEKGKLTLKNHIKEYENSPY
jgi:hypothetical protein